MEKVEIEMWPDPQQGTKDLGFDDPSFAMTIVMDQMLFTQESRKHDSKMTAVLHSLTVIDKANLRFPHAIESIETKRLRGVRCQEEGFRKTKKGLDLIRHLQAGKEIPKVRRS